MVRGEGAGDHQKLAIGIDEISVSSAVGILNSKLRSRRLIMNDPRIVGKYIILLDKYYVLNNIYRNVLKMNTVPIE